LLAPARGRRGGRCVAALRRRRQRRVCLDLARTALLRLPRLLFGLQALKLYMLGDDQGAGELAPLALDGAEVANVGCGEVVLDEARLKLPVSVVHKNMDLEFDSGAA
jgi:hypothetical protein